MARGWVSRAVATGSVAAGAGGAGAAAAGWRRAERRRCCRCHRGSAAGGWAGSHAHPQVMPSPDAAPAAQPGAPGEGAVSADALLLAGRGRPARYSAGAPLFPPLRPCNCSARGRAVSSPPCRLSLPAGSWFRGCTPATPGARRGSRAAPCGPLSPAGPPGVTRSLAARTPSPAGRWARAGLANGRPGGGSRRRRAVPRSSAARGSGRPRRGRRCRLSRAPQVNRGAAARTRPKRPCGVALRPCRCQRYCPSAGGRLPWRGDVPPVGWADGCRGAPAAGFEP